ncbi:MAG: hypothetical protein HY965_05990 [Ignavibacteriales bacterium]|nr:hypothetical protein [Ignavibacteriales bacterium]
MGKPKINSLLFLPYQLAWLKDTSTVKVWEKSRRIGATFVQSYEDVSDIMQGKYPAVWFSSADESAAREYIQYCQIWVNLFTRARSQNELILKENKRAGQLQLQFANGGRITALSSNPKAFRSKGGKVVIDEFAHHEDDEGLWKAAKPAVTWGFPLRVLSTHNGKQSLFYRFTEKIRNGELPWALHTTTIHQAVTDGLVNRILKKDADTTETQAWLDELRKSCYSDIIWNEEFCCIPVDEATALLPYKVLEACVENECAPAERFAFYSNPPCEEPIFIGVDIGRKHDATIMYGFTPRDGKLITTLLIRMQNKPFTEQKQELRALLAMPQVRHCVIDATGMGMALAEEARQEFGKHKVTSLNFTPAVKEELAYLITSSFEERKLVIPHQQELLTDLHSVRRYVTGAGNVAYEAARTSAGHGDVFWALAMALMAVKTQVATPSICSGGRKKSAKLLRGFK